MANLEQTLGGGLESFKAEINDALRRVKQGSTQEEATASRASLKNFLLDFLAPSVGLEEDPEGGLRSMSMRDALPLLGIGALIPGGRGAKKVISNKLLQEARKRQALRKAKVRKDPLLEPKPGTSIAELSNKKLNVSFKGTGKDEFDFIIHQGGNSIGGGNIILDGENLLLANINVKGGANSLGPKAIQDILKQVKVRFPSIKRIKGIRTEARLNRMGIASDDDALLRGVLNQEVTIGNTFNAPVRKRTPSIGEAFREPVN